jgi:ABC-type uncharacterized transport system substrate-binding protein
MPGGDQEERILARHTRGCLRARSPAGRRRIAMSWRRALRHCVLGVLVLLCPAVMAQEYLAVVTSSDAAPHADFVAGLEQSLRAGVDDNGWTLRVSTTLPASNATNGAKAIIAVGAEATRAVAEADPPLPVLFALIPRSLADQVVVKGHGPRGAIVLDQSPARRFALIAALLPNARRVAIPYGPVSRALRASVEAEARERGFSVNSREVLREDEIHRVLSRTLRGADVLLAIPDPVVFSRDVTRNVLLDTYRARVPVIGYSSAWVAAGALAAIYAAPADLGADAAELLRVTLATDNRIPEGVNGPRRFQLGINPQVARSLGIVVPDAATLRRRIEEATQ